jgi:hypothetical protein
MRFAGALNRFELAEAHLLIQFPVASKPEMILALDCG